MYALPRVLLMIPVLAAAGSAFGEPVAAPADMASVRSLVTILRAPRTTSDRLTQTVIDLAAMNPHGVAALDGHVTKEIEGLITVVESRPKTVSLDEEITRLRDILQKLRENPELSKDELKSEGLPALESLTAAWHNREASLAPWQKKKEAALGQAKKLATVIQVWQEADPAAAVAAHQGKLTAVTARLSPEDPQTIQVLAENGRLGAGIPGDIAPAMHAVNSIRMACGLAPLLFDAKLCEAASMHSRDMESNDFFSHESPLPGKTAFTDRAKLADTTASGENIFMGSSAGDDAIKAWFLSPGHHKNMLGAGQVRQGLGRSGKYWTQLFGR
jgi:uncharacterized protein YkwD